MRFLPCLRAMNSGISSIGPGPVQRHQRDDVLEAVGGACLSRSRMPRDSNWNTAVVLPEASIA